MSKNSYRSTIHQIARLISKSRTQQLTDDESTMLKEWLDSDPKHVEMYIRLSAKVDRGKLEDMLSRDPMRHYHKIIGENKQNNKVSWLFKYGVRMAAASLLIALLLPFGPISERSTASLDTVVLDHSPDEVTLWSNAGSENISVHADSVYHISTLVGQQTRSEDGIDHQEEPLTISTPIGKTIAFTLQDGSTVYLNSKSTITFDNSQNFRKNRDVVLDGEAYFVIAEDQEHPFVVTNAGREIKVLGTAFNVKGYEGQDKFKLGLASGKVALTMADQGYTDILSPGHEVTYDKATNRISKVTNENINNIGAWRKGVYAFEQIPIDELARDMELMYPITFKYEKDVPKYLFSGEFSREENWMKILDKLEMTNRVKFIVEGNEIIVRDIRYVEEIMN